MKFLKILLLIIGVIGLIVAGVLLGPLYVNLNTLTNVANANNSKQPFADPYPQVMMVAGLAAAGGLLAGLGLGLPRRTSGQIRAEALDGVSAQREAAIRARAAGEQPRA